MDDKMNGPLNIPVLVDVSEEDQKRIGWIDRDGKLHRCRYGGHDRYVYEHLEKEVAEIDNAGWVRAQGFEGTGLPWSAVKRINAAQRNKLSRLGYNPDDRNDDLGHEFVADLKDVVVPDSLREPGPITAPEPARKKRPTREEELEKNNWIPLKGDKFNIPVEGTAVPIHRAVRIPTENGGSRGKMYFKAGGASFDVDKYEGMVAGEIGTGYAISVTHKESGKYGSFRISARDILHILLPILDAHPELLSRDK